MLCSGCHSCPLMLFPGPQKALETSHSRRTREPDCMRLVKVGLLVSLRRFFANLAKIPLGGCRTLDLARPIQYSQHQPCQTVHLGRTCRHRPLPSQACQLSPRELRPRVGGHPRLLPCHQTSCPISMRTSRCNPLSSPRNSLLHPVLPDSDDEVIRSLLATVHLARDPFAAMVWLSLTSRLQAVVEAG